MGLHPMVMLSGDHQHDRQPNDDETGVKKTEYHNGLTLQQLVIADSTESDDDLTNKVPHLLQQIAELIAENAALEEQIVSLNQQLSRYDDAQIKPVDGYFTMEQFLAILIAKRRASHGWRKAYIEASGQSQNCKEVSNETIQTWKNKDRVPEWAVEQISRMVFNKRPGISGVPWTDTDETFLIEKYRADPRQSNAAFAIMCSTEFNRTITENAIKGALDRARKNGFIESKRPGKHVG